MNGSWAKVACWRFELHHIPMSRNRQTSCKFNPGIQKCHVDFYYAVDMLIRNDLYQSMYHASLMLMHILS